MMPNSKAIVVRKNLIPIFSGLIKDGITNFYIKIVPILIEENHWDFGQKKWKIETFPRLF